MNASVNDRYAADLGEALTPHSKLTRAEANRELANPGEVNRPAMFISGGLVGLYRDSYSGCRRVVALRYPGEFVGPHEVSFGIETLQPSEVLTTDNDTFAAAVESARLEMEFAQENERLKTIAYEWLARDAMDSLGRVAHFLCEHAERSGRGGDHRHFHLDLTQAQLGAITAQTSVNVNRIMRALEKEQILRPLGPKRYNVDWPELRRQGNFDPSYLQR